MAVNVPSHYYRDDAQSTNIIVSLSGQNIWRLSPLYAALLA